MRKSKEPLFRFYQKAGKRDMLVEKTESELNFTDKDFLLGTLLDAWENNPYENQHKFIKMFIEKLQQPIEDKQLEVLSQYMDWLDVNKK